MDEDACEMHLFGLERMVRRKMGATIVIGVVIFAYAGFIVYKKVKDRKRGIADADVPPAVESAESKRTWGRCRVKCLNWHTLQRPC